MIHFGPRLDNKNRNSNHSIAFFSIHKESNLQGKNSLSKKNLNHVKIQQEFCLHVYCIKHIIYLM